MKAVIGLIMILTPLLLSGVQPDSSGVIEIEVRDIRNTEGQIRISLFESEAGFPGEYQEARQYVNLNIKGKSMPAIFENIPYGIYAVAVLHDEDGNNKLTTNWLGIPKEGIAVSNNAKRLFGAPSFGDAKFVFNKQRIKLVIALDYF